MALCLSLLIGVGACSEEEIAYSAGEENKEVILQLIVSCRPIRK